MANNLKNKKLMIFVGGMGRGGAERVISLIANYFAEKNWTVYIVLLLYKEVGYSLHKNVEIVDLTCGLGRRIFRLPKWLKYIRKLVKTINPDKILSFVARIGVLTHLACWGLNNEIFVSERNDPYEDGRSKILDFLTNYFYPKSKGIIFQTKRASSYFRHLNLANQYIIPNPISVSCFANYYKNNRIVSVGRLAPQKNQKMLINAFSVIIKRFPDIYLDIYGEGDLKEDLQNQINALKLSSRVALKGNVTNIHEEIANASVFILSSDYEGLSNALLEAMAMGLPCISTNCAGSDEYIQNGVNGLLVNIRDESQLIKAIEFILKNKSLAQNMGQNAKKSLESISNKKILERWYKLLTD